MPVSGTPRFDSLAVGEVHISFQGEFPVVKAKAAYIDSKTGATHGYTTSQKWSQTTLELLQKVREALEADIASRDFQNFAPQQEMPFTGLGEHLAGDGQPL